MLPIVTVSPSQLVYRLAIYYMLLAKQRLKFANVSHHVVLRQRLEISGRFPRAPRLEHSNFPLAALSDLRQVYRVTINLMYSSKTFVVHDPHLP